MIQKPAIADSNERNKTFRWILIILGVLLICGVLLGVGCYVLAQKAKENLNDILRETEREANFSFKDSDQITDNKSKSNIVDSLRCEIGKVISNERIEFVVYSVNYTDSLGRSSSSGEEVVASEGHNFAIFDVSLKNIGREVYYVYVDQDFYIKDTDGKKYTNREFGDPLENPLGSAVKLSSNESVRGDIAIQIPQNISTEEMVLVYDSFTDESLASFEVEF